MDLWPYNAPHTDAVRVGLLKMTLKINNLYLSIGFWGYFSVEAKSVNIYRKAVDSAGGISRIRSLATHGADDARAVL